MGSDNLLKLETWVGALHTAHENVRWHTGGCMSCEVGIIHSKESKQKLNIKSTTESEVVSVSEYVPNKNHMMHFGGQGYTLHQKFLLEKNVINSCTGNSRHISIRYFLLGIMWIRRSLVLSTDKHRRSSPTSSLNHCKGHFFDFSGKSYWDECTLTFWKIMSHLQRRSELKIMSLETNQKPCRRQLTSSS